MSLGQFEDLVQSAIALGVPRLKAEAAVRERLRLPPVDVPTPEAERDARVRENAEQREVVKRFRVCGFEIFNLSQTRASKIAIGIPDLWFMHATLPVALYWETKRQVGGRFSDKQRAFAAACLRCNVGYGSGDRYDAERWLVEHHLADVDRDGSLLPNSPRP